MAIVNLAHPPISGTIREDGMVFFRGGWKTQVSVSAAKAKKRSTDARYLADAAKSKRWRERHAETNKIAQRRFRLTVHGRAQSMYYNSKSRARRSGLPFEIDMPWIAAKIIAGRCEVTGIEFDLGGSGTRYNPWAPSLDQRIPGKGYTPENVQMVCNVHNASKNEWDETVHRRYIEACARSYGLI